MNNIKIIIEGKEYERSIEELAKGLVTVSAQNPVYCIKLGTLNNGNPIFNDDIFVDENGDLHRIKLDDGAIISCDVENTSDDFLWKYPYKNWTYIGNYNIKSSFENHPAYVEYLKRISK